MYGIEVILLNSILMLALLGISIVGRDLILFIGFLLFFIPIRTFAGGYHAKHSETCFVISVGIYILTMIIFNQFPDLYRNIIGIGLFTVSIVVICIWSPLKNPRHPLADYQCKRNRRIVFGIIAIYIVLFIIFSTTDCVIASSEVIFIVLASIFLIVGKLDSSKYMKEHLEMNK